MTKTQKLLYHWLPLTGYCLFIFIQSAHPLTDLIPPRPALDKLLHVEAISKVQIAIKNKLATKTAGKAQDSLIGRLSANELWRIRCIFEIASRIAH